MCRVRRASSAVIVSMPRGDGRLLLSGAMDAWRFRAADNGAFDRFWQSTIAGLALAAPPPIAIDVEPPLLRPGEPADVIVRVRSRDVVAVSASCRRRSADPPAARAGGWRLSRPIRREDASAGRFERSRSRSDRPRARAIARTVLVAAGRPARCARAAAVARDALRVSPRYRRDARANRPSSNGSCAIAVPPPRAPMLRHPMRSTWWMLPFAAVPVGRVVAAPARRDFADDIG